MEGPDVWVVAGEKSGGSFEQFYGDDVRADD
jgi:hypothetical protein